MISRVRCIEIDVSWFDSRSFYAPGAEIGLIEINLETQNRELEQQQIGSLARDRFCFDISFTFFSDFVTRLFNARSTRKTKAEKTIEAIKVSF